MTRTTSNEQGQCRVRSGTERPCHRPAVVKVRGIPFCERCAREQEVYFAIGELTEPPSRLHHDEPLVGMLGRIRQIRLERRLVSDHKPDAA